MPIRVVMNKQSISILSLLLLCLSWEAGAYDEKDLGKLKAIGDCPSCDLSDADLTDANLYEANLLMANLSKVDLTKAILVHSSLFLANLTGANLFKANLSGAILCNTTKSDGRINDSGC